MRFLSRVDLLPLSALALLSSGCLSIDLPEDFLRIHRSPSQIKLMAADESKLWVRDFDDDDQGDLQFWSQALREDFVENRGYTLIEEGTVKDPGDREGREWLFETTTHGQPYRYLVTLFVFEGWFSNTIRVSEFVARKAAFDRYLEDVRAAVLTVR